MMPITPSGCGRNSVLAGRNHMDAHERLDFIHERTCFFASSTAVREGKISNNFVSCKERLPKSALMAAAISSTFSVSNRSSCERVSRRDCSVGIRAEAYAARARLNTSCNVEETLMPDWLRSIFAAIW